MFKYNRIFHKVELYKMYLGGVFMAGDKEKKGMIVFTNSVLIQLWILK